MRSERVNTIKVIILSGLLFILLMIGAAGQSDTVSKTYVTVKDTKNTVDISVDASRTFTGYHWDDDGKTLIITYEEGDHAAD